MDKEVLNQPENKADNQTDALVPVITDSASNELTDTHDDEINPPLELKNLDVDFAFDLLSVPTVSKHEYRLVTFIIMWARANKIKYDFDDYGNLYLTKGELEEGEFYPCVTSHLDTVQREQEAYAQCGVPLQLKERITKKGHELYVDDTGIGADDKAGVLISLSLFQYFDKLKACFFLEEEIGCKGSENLDEDWFENVGYVIGWDSPDRNRAAYSCSSELLMSKEFFEKIEETCKENGVTDFRSEPFTDVKEIRKKTEIICMNFGNGGYNAHASSEYVVLEDIDGAIGLGIALIKLLGLNEYKMKSKSDWAYKSTDDDVNFFNTKFRSYYGYQYGNYGRKTYSPSGSNTSNTTPTKTEKQNNNNLEEQVLEYVVERYETHISNIQLKCEERDAEILLKIKEIMNRNGGCTFQDIVNIFDDVPSSLPFSTAIEF